MVKQHKNKPSQRKIEEKCKFQKNPPLSKTLFYANKKDSKDEWFSLLIFKHDVLLWAFERDRIRTIPLVGFGCFGRVFKGPE